MSLGTLHHKRRLICVGGLLTLMAAQSRLWAGPLAEPVVVVRAAERRSDNPQKPKRRPIALLKTLPDPAPLRWAPSVSEIEETDPQAAATVWCADAGFRPNGSGYDHLPAWCSLARPALPNGLIAAVPDQARLSNLPLRLFGTICPTGPPRS